MAELGYEGGIAGVLACYEGLIDGLVVDERDGLAQELSGGVRIFSTDTLMTGALERERLARFCLGCIDSLDAPV